MYISNVGRPAAERLGSPVWNSDCLGHLVFVCLFVVLRVCVVSWSTQCMKPPIAL